MRIGVIQATSQADKNQLLLDCTARAAAHLDPEITNFGAFPGESGTYTYVETAVAASLLLCSGAVDFIVTGCSSGQGMMLACNSLPGVFCGYAPTPQDAYLFARINGGNAVSLPLGLGFGWAGEINLQCTLDKLFDGPFGCGWPPSEAERKARDTRQLKAINSLAKRGWPEIAPDMAESLTRIRSREPVMRCLMEYGTLQEILDILQRA